CGCSQNVISFNCTHIGSPLYNSRETSLIGSSYQRRVTGIDKRATVTGKQCRQWSAVVGQRLQKWTDTPTVMGRRTADGRSTGVLNEIVVCRGEASTVYVWSAATYANQYAASDDCVSER